ncbi:MAG TPA: SGNH/GDSL hydrolase family protein [Anaeromyxobacteraceae bacterium]|nr:SGNH/GDSL hydrolase family protein [Anaeromyxobacteraceae bacterium]
MASRSRSASAGAPVLAALLSLASLAPGDAAGTQAATGAPPSPRIAYPADRTQSPISPEVAQRLRELARRGPDGRLPVFVKVGDSVSSGGLRGPFLGCLDGASGARADFGGRADLEEAAAYFRSVPAAGSQSPYARESLAVEVGRPAAWAAGGSPTPVERELEAVRPGVAIVMFGSNDVLCYGCGLTDWEMASIYFGNLRRIADQLIERGVIPVLVSAPPRSDDPAHLRRAPLFAAAVRALAQGRLVPFVDYEREMERLPGLGLRDDRVHPSFCRSGIATACRFDDGSCAGRPVLSYGYNVLNLAVLDALSRVKRAVVDRSPPPDPAPQRLEGSGTWAAPIVAAALPFVDVRDARRDGVKAVKNYACRGAPQAPGPEVVYRLVLARTSAVRVAVLDGTSRLDGPARFSVNLLDGSGKPRGCLRAAERSVAATLAAGTYHISIDSLDPAGAGEFAVVVAECATGDEACR